MKKKNYFVLIIIIFILVFIWFYFFNHKTKEEEVNDLNLLENENKKVSLEKLGNDTYYLNKEKSQFIWQASRKPVESYINKGTIDFISGYFILEDDKIFEGEFIFDMETLKVTDMSNFDSKIDLENHLKSSDFFNVSEFNRAILSVKEGKKSPKDDAGMLYEITADLTIKGISNEIDFYIMLYQKSNENIAEASLKLNRALWDIRYGSDKFFDLLADETIDDIFEVNLNLVFN